MPETTETGPPRRERKKREARRRIFEAAFALFVEQGYDRTTVEEIAARADVAKGTVFNYFPRKTSLLAALAEDWTSRIEETLGPMDSWTGTTREKLATVFRFLADLGARNPPLARLAFFESLRHMHQMVEERRRTVERPVRRFQAITRTVLRQGQLAGEIRPEISVELAASLIESAFHHSLAEWLAAGGSRARLQRQLAEKLDIVFGGLAAPAPAPRRPSRTARTRGRG